MLEGKTFILGDQKIDGKDFNLLHHACYKQINEKHCKILLDNCEKIDIYLDGLAPQALFDK